LAGDLLWILDRIVAVRNLAVITRGKLRSSRPNNVGKGCYISPFLTLTALLMPTACKSDPLGIEVRRVRSQPSRQPTLDVKVIHRIAELEFELLSIVHDHYGHDLPTVSPMYIPIQESRGNTHIFETCERLLELDNHLEGPCRSVRSHVLRGTHLIVVLLCCSKAFRKD
jgi:hypothetical protein